MLQLRAYAPPEKVAEVVTRLDEMSGVRHLITGGVTARGMVELTAEIDPDTADEALDVLRGCDLAADDVTLWRATSIQPLGWRRRRVETDQGAAVWAEVMGRANQHAKPTAAFVVFMVAAGVVAGVGVIQASSILIVGAMAISPDLLPISAAAVGVAISVTTIPAAAYMGVALALAGSNDWTGALTVLSVNVVSIVAASTLTLAAAVWRARRAIP